MGLIGGGLGGQLLSGATAKRRHGGRHRRLGGGRRHPDGHRGRDQEHDGQIDLANQMSWDEEANSGLFLSQSRRVRNAAAPQRNKGVAAGQKRSQRCGWEFVAGG